MDAPATRRLPVAARGLRPTGPARNLMCRVLATRMRSRAVENAREAPLVGTILAKRPAHRGERSGERKDVAGHQKIDVVRPDRMPVDAAFGDRDLRHQIGASDGYAVLSEPAQRNPPDDAVFFGNLLHIEETAEFRLLGFFRHRRGDADAKTVRAGAG